MYVCPVILLFVLSIVMFNIQLNCQVQHGFELSKKRIDTEKIAITRDYIVNTNSI